MAINKEELKEKLKKYRGRKAYEYNIEPYKVYTDAMLDAVLEKAPTTMKELMNVKGFGEKRCEYYGEDILAIINGSLNKSSAFSR